MAQSPTAPMPPRWESDDSVQAQGVTKKPRNPKNLRIDLTKAGKRDISSQQSTTGSASCLQGLTSSPESPAQLHMRPRSLSLRSPALVRGASGERLLRKRSTTSPLTIPHIATQHAEVVALGRPNQADPLWSSSSSSTVSSSSSSPESESTSPSSGLWSATDIARMNAESDKSAAASDPLSIAVSTADASNENAYPHGPVCVLEPNLFLYSEPTLDQLTQFDMIINVAQEIKDYSYQVNNADRPTAYHFMPWTHNSRLVSDFTHLTDIIDEALNDNKKVLIHCQCGISRSASLVIAYFMKIRHCDYNEAYMELKKKAPSISPNLSLIYELMEWGQHLRGESVSSTTTTTTTGSSTLIDEDC